MTFLSASKLRKKSVLSTGCLLLLWGCAGTVEIPESESDPLPAAPSGLTLPISFNEVMVGPIDHAAHELWDIAVEERAPQSDDDWIELEHHAIQLAAMGRAIMIPGTGVGDALWAQGDEWSRYAGEMTDGAMAALEAVQNRDSDGVLAAGTVFLEACIGCHMVYKPDIPSEEEFHPHYRGGA